MLRLLLRTASTWLLGTDNRSPLNRILWDGKHSFSIVFVKGGRYQAFVAREGIVHDGQDRDGSHGEMQHADALAQQTGLLPL